MFFALKGERVDGHQFVRDAYAAGSPAIIVSDPSVAEALASSGSLVC